MNFESRDGSTVSRGLDRDEGKGEKKIRFAPFSCERERENGVKRSPFVERSPISFIEAHLPCFILRGIARSWIPVRLLKIEIAICFLQISKRVVRNCLRHVIAQRCAEKRSFAELSAESKLTM